MTENDRTIIENFEEKLHRLVIEYKQAEDRNKELTAIVLQKENSLKELQENEFSDLKDTENLLSVRLGNLI